jgi:Mn-dependent DtxR family transcriptional regulator
VNSKQEEVKERIIEALRRIHNEPISKREIARLLNVSPATASKYVDILQAEKRVEVKDYGNINLVTIKRR